MHFVRSKCLVHGLYECSDALKHSRTRSNPESLLLFMLQGINETITNQNHIYENNKTAVNAINSHDPSCM